MSPTSKKAKKMPRIPGPGLGAVKNKAQEKVIKVKDAAAATAGGALSVAAGAAATAQGAASQVKDLKKFMDLDLEVFNSTEEADRKEMEEDLNNRKKWGGILHPETTTSVLYNQVRKEVYFLGGRSFVGRSPSCLKCLNRALQMLTWTPLCAVDARGLPGVYADRAAGADRVQNRPIAGHDGIRG